MIKKFLNIFHSFFSLLYINIQKIYKKIRHNYFYIGLVSLIWYLLRTGSKPSRANYPCQKVAVTNINVWLTLYLFPIFSFIKRKGKKPIFFTVAAILIISIISPLLVEKIRPIRADNTNIILSLQEHNATEGSASDIYVVTNTTGYDNGFLASVSLMGSHGLKFYNSNLTWDNQGPDGLIDNDDVIIIKVNCQWDERGGTNTDLLKSIIEAIINHPDGFTGEIVVADNGQKQFGSDDTGGSLDWENSNAETHSQSVQKVVDQFSNSYQVSTYLWDYITLIQVDEYSDGNYTDGFVVNTTANSRTGVMVSYPKFQSKYGTNISFKKGIWNSSSNEYNSQRLKIINVAVLKTHLNFGVTASVKHYMGIPSDFLTEQHGARTHPTIDEGGMGTLLAETRMPILNVLDAIWIKVPPWAGPWNRYGEANRVNVTLVSTDPVAIDYWASKNILMQAASQLGYSDLTSMDPDNNASGSFGNWLQLSKEEINNAGYEGTTNYSQMNVLIKNMHSQPLLEFKQGWNLISMPIEPVNPSINSLFSDKIIDVEAIFSYSNEEWEYWLPNVKSTLENLTCGNGYWILTNDNFTISLEGSIADGYQLSQDWNLIGVNNTHSVTTTDYLSNTTWTQVYCYDEEADTWYTYIRDLGGPVNIMEPGEGYWVFNE